MVHAMNYLNTMPNATAVGLAYSPSVAEFVADNPGLVDYVEIPFEQLRHTPAVASIQEKLPVILHCASMSVAGFVPPGDATLNAIDCEAKRTRTPWIGEHLAFISAESLDQENNASGTALTYTVCPQMSEETVARVAKNVAALQPRFGAPLILENSPQYFDVPGSTMPINPLDSVASASAAHAAHIQARLAPAVASARCAMKRHPSPTLIHSVSPASRVRMCALRTYHRQLPNTAALYRASIAPPRRSPT